MIASENIGCFSSLKYQSKKAVRALGELHVAALEVTQGAGEYSY